MSNLGGGGMARGGLAGLAGVHGNALLGLLGGPLEVKSVYYNQKVVPLDGYHFRECRFDGCTLVVSSTNFVLDHCILDDACVIQYGGSLVKVVQLFTSRYRWMHDSVPGLAPVKNSDGTISIG